MNKRMSPCMGCTRVRDPRACENKNCQLWQKWFIRRWEEMRRNFLGEAYTPQRLPVPLGGRQYADTHKVRAYLDTDPCSQCVCDKELCYEPCPSRHSWEMVRRDVFL